MMKEKYLEFYEQKNRKKTIYQSSFFLLYTYSNNEFPISIVAKF